MLVPESLPAIRRFVQTLNRRDMLTKSILLYLSNSPGFKNFLTRFQSFNNVTRRFVAGEELTDAVAAIRQLNRKQIRASFDHLGESISAESETRAEVREYTE